MANKLDCLLGKPLLSSLFLPNGPTDLHSHLLCCVVFLHGFRQRTKPACSWAKLGYQTLCSLTTVSSEASLVIICLFDGMGVIYTKYVPLPHNKS